LFITYVDKSLLQAFFSKIIDLLPSVVDDDVDVRPRFELSLPIRNGGQWGNDQIRAFDAVVVDSLQKSDRLDSLSQAHLVRQYAVTPVGEKE
jgi:hypothetical protein